jgi:hypothetical protein
MMLEADMRAVEIFLDTKLFDQLTALENVKNFTAKVYRPLLGAGAVDQQNLFGEEFGIPLERKYAAILEGWKTKIERNWRIAHPVEVAAEGMTFSLIERILWENEGQVRYFHEKTASQIGEVI